MALNARLIRNREVAEDFLYNFEKNTVFEADRNMGGVGRDGFF